MVFVDTRAAILSLMAFGGDVRRAADEALTDAADAALLSAQGTTLFRDRTGDLRRTLLVRVGKWRRTLWAPKNYASFINDGTRPHVIRARNVQFLRFVQAGQVRFARSVKHPGTAKRPFMDNASRQGAQALMTTLREKMEAAIAKAST